MPVIERFQRQVFARPSGAGQQITDPGLARAGAALINAPGQAALQRGLSSFDQAFQQIAVDKAETEATEAFNTTKQGGLDKTVAEELSKTGPEAEGMSGRVKDAYEKAHAGVKLSGLAGRRFREHMQREGASAISSASRREVVEQTKRREAARQSNVENETNRIHAGLVDSGGIADPRPVLAGMTELRESIAVATENMDPETAKTYQAAATTDYYSKLFGTLKADGRIKDAEELLALGKQDGMIQETHDRLKSTIRGVADTEQAFEDFDNLTNRTGGDPIEARKLAKELPPVRRKAVTAMLDHEITKAREIKNQEIRASNNEIVEDIYELISPLRAERLTSADQLRIVQLRSGIRDNAALGFNLDRKIADALAGKRILVSNDEQLAEIQNVLQARVLDVNKVQEWVRDNHIRDQYLTQEDIEYYGKQAQTIAATGGLPVEAGVKTSLMRAYKAQLTGSKKQRALATARHEKELDEALRNESRITGGKGIKPERADEINNFIFQKRALESPVSIRTRRGRVRLPTEIFGTEFDLASFGELTPQELNRIAVPDEDADRLRENALGKTLSDIDSRVRGDDKDTLFDDLDESDKEDFLQALYVSELEAFHLDIRPVP